MIKTAQESEAHTERWEKNCLRRLVLRRGNTCKLAFYHNFGEI
jgi:hypothetical protein